MTKSHLSYKRHRFPPEIITHAVWLYCRFNLSFREVEEMFLERGIDVSYETIRRWVAKFGPAIARELGCRQHQPGDIWYLDEILQGRRNTAAEKRLLTRLMKRHGRSPKRFIIDKLRSYDAAKRKIAPKTAICRSENEKKRCNGSYRSIQPSEIASPFLPVAALH